jgi:hypothetical protein
MSQLDAAHSWKTHRITLGLCLLCAALAGCAPDSVQPPPTPSPILASSSPTSAISSAEGSRSGIQNEVNRIYQNPTYGFSLELPTEIEVTPRDNSHSSGSLGQDAEFEVTIEDPLDCQTECPEGFTMRGSVTIKNLTGQVARGMTAATPASEPLEFMSYVFEKNGLFYRFTLFGLAEQSSNPDLQAQRMITPRQQLWFEEMLSTLIIEPPLALIATPALSETTYPSSNLLTTDVIVKYTPGDEPLLVSLVMIDPAIGWAVAGGSPLDQHILRTQDGGRTWRDVTPPEPASRSAGSAKNAIAFFLDQSSAWVTFHPISMPVFAPSPVWFTHDGGASWEISETLVSSSKDSIWVPEEIYFVDRRIGWLKFSHGQTGDQAPLTIFRTDDAGRRWRAISEPSQTDNPDLHTCCKTNLGFLDNLTGLMLDRGGQSETPSLIWSRDGGVTWINQLLPPAEPGLFQNAICAPEDSEVLPSSSVKLVITCYDPDSPESPPFSYLYSTETAGNTWSTIPLPVPAQVVGDWNKHTRITSIAFLDAVSGWLFQNDHYQFTNNQQNAENTFIRSTENSGIDWTLPVTVYWSGQFSFVNPKAGWALAHSGQTSALVQTTDGGITWELIYPRIIP